jgi:hypothetical protein
VDDLLLESESHTVFVRESLVRDAETHLTVADCYAGYVEFCNERGWRALTRNKFGAVIGDALPAVSEWPDLDDRHRNQLHFPLIDRICSLEHERTK